VACTGQECPVLGHYKPLVMVVRIRVEDTQLHLASACLLPEVHPRHTVPGDSGNCGPTALIRNIVIGQPQSSIAGSFSSSMFAIPDTPRHANPNLAALIANACR